MKRKQQEFLLVSQNCWGSMTDKNTRFSSDVRQGSSAADVLKHFLKIKCQKVSFDSKIRAGLKIKNVKTQMNSVYPRFEQVCSFLWLRNIILLGHKL